MSPRLSNHINGTPVASRANRWIDNIDPATGERISEIPRSDASDVDAAAQAARQAFEGPWRETSRTDRADLLDAIADGISDRLDEFAVAESRDNGKPLSLARAVDIPRAVANFRFFAGAIRHQSTGFHGMADGFNYTLREPVGVFGLITPWNLPLYLHSWKVAPALAMGNTVVAKPSELTPTTASLLAEVTQAVGLPAGVYNLVHGYGHETGQAIVEHPDIKGISFTGGTQTGETVARTAAPLFKKLSLELGGKNPTLVFADADFDKAVAGAVRAAFLNQGQICLCGSRVLVERRIHDRFVEAMAAQASALRVGSPSDPESNLGALVSHAHRDKVASYVALGRQEGGTVLCGGKVPDLPAPFSGGAFYEPTVISGLSASCRTSTEEIFGPVVTVHPFDSEEEAVAMANGVRYGLAASVWTEDLRRAHRVSAALRTGMVWVNTWLKRDLRVPFGGVKDSGVGREGGSYSLSFYSEDKNVCIQLD